VSRSMGASSLNLRENHRDYLLCSYRRSYLKYLCRIQYSIMDTLSEKTWYLAKVLGEDGFLKLFSW
jgi:hypothetical protein